MHHLHQVMYRDRHTNPPCNWLVIPQCYCTNTLTYVHTQTHTHSHSDTVEPVYPRVSYNMVIIGLYRGMAALQRYRLQCFSALLVLFGAREAVRFREVTALHSDCLRQDPQYTYTHKHTVHSHTERIACSRGLFHISSLCKHARTQSEHSSTLKLYDRWRCVWYCHMLNNRLYQEVCRCWSVQLLPPHMLIHETLKYPFNHMAVTLIKVTAHTIDTCTIVLGMNCHFSGQPGLS